jgi:hypothetical protein
VTFAGFGDTKDPGEDACREQTATWFRTVMGVLADDEALVDYLSDTLVELGESVPEKIDGFRLDAARNLHEDRSWLALDKLPKELFVAPGTKITRRLRRSAWLNTEAKDGWVVRQLACSADLPSRPRSSLPRRARRRRACQPSAREPWRRAAAKITEFTNSLVVGSRRQRPRPRRPPRYFARATYGSFSTSSTR